MRQIVLDTETTGLDASKGHRIIEIGCVELIDRKLTGNHFHEYINPERQVDLGAFEVHGISDEFLESKPIFAEIGEKFIEYVSGSELIIHNAAFDIGFLNAELQRVPSLLSDLNEVCQVTDSLLMARDKHPGQKNNLDALCKRYDVEAFDRTLHGALLDSQILAQVYLRMTGGQTSLGLQSSDSQGTSGKGQSLALDRIDFSARQTRVIQPSSKELQAHESLLDKLENTAESGCLWRKSLESS